MNVLLSADGPFKGCSPDDGHRTKLAPCPARNPRPGSSDPPGQQPCAEHVPGGVHPQGW
jgi:hypothetical protein